MYIYAIFKKNYHLLIIFLSFKSSLSFKKNWDLYDTTDSMISSL